MSPQRWVAVVSFVIGLGGGPVSGQCTLTEIGIRPDSANSFADVILGEALGQTFTAQGLLIESITVWRIPQQTGSVFGMHLYIVETDSLGNPDLDHILLNGPTVFNTGVDTLTPAPFEFVFDPPFQLPHPGVYEFAVQSEPCYGNWTILAVDGRDDYPSGCLWGHSRSIFSGCGLRKFPRPYPAADLCFGIRYCDYVTPTRKSTWGHLKALYR